MNRSNGKERRIHCYKSSQKILLVGEGDFSFSACLACAFRTAENIVATSYLDRESLIYKHWTSIPHLDELENLGCLLLHNVDVYKMDTYPILKNKKFDIIIYNFPHAGHYDYLCERDPELIEMHKDLVEAYFRSASKMLTEGGEVHLRHRDDPPYDSWNVVSLARKAGLTLKEKVDFQKSDYPGYHNKRGGDININKSFLIICAFTFKFIPYIRKVVDNHYNCDLSKKDQVHVLEMDNQVHGDEIQVVCKEDKVCDHVNVSKIMEEDQGEHSKCDKVDNKFQKVEVDDILKKDEAHVLEMHNQVHHDEIQVLCENDKVYGYVNVLKIKEEDQGEQHYKPDKVEKKFQKDEVDDLLEKDQVLVLKMNNQVHDDETQVFSEKDTIYDHVNVSKIEEEDQGENHLKRDKDHDNEFQKDEVDDILEEDEADENLFIQKNDESPLLLNHLVVDELKIHVLEMVDVCEHGDLLKKDDQRKDDQVHVDLELLKIIDDGYLLEKDEVNVDHDLPRVDDDYQIEIQHLPNKEDEACALSMMDQDHDHQHSKHEEVQDRSLKSEEIDSDLLKKDALQLDNNHPNNNEVCDEIPNKGVNDTYLPKNGGVDNNLDVHEHSLKNDEVDHVLDVYVKEMKDEMEQVHGDMYARVLEMMGHLQMQQTKYKGNCLIVPDKDHGYDDDGDAAETKDNVHEELAETDVTQDRRVDATDDRVDGYDNNHPPNKDDVDDHGDLLEIKAHICVSDGDVYKMKEPALYDAA